MNLCDEASMPRPVLSQQIYNPLIRQLDIEYFKFTTRYPIHTTVYNALAGGLLAACINVSVTAGSRFDSNPLYQRRYWTEHFRVRRGAAGARRGGEAQPRGARVRVGRRASGGGLRSPWPGVDRAARLCARCRGPAATSAVGTQIEELHRAFTGTDASYAR